MCVGELKICVASPGQNEILCASPLSSKLSRVKQIELTESSMSETLVKCGEGCTRKASGHCRLL